MSQHEIRTLQSRWRWMVVATATLILCSCRAPAPPLPQTGQLLPPSSAMQSPAGAPVAQPTSAMAASPTMAPTAPVIQATHQPGQPAAEVTVATQTQRAQANAPATCWPQESTGWPAQSGPLPSEAWAGACPTCPEGTGGTWAPPGIEGPWPADEYICDGGDFYESVRIGSDFSVAGLNIEDTVVHFDTREGEVSVEPSNRVCIYAPRFAAVRQVRGLRQHELHLIPNSHYTPDLAIIDDLWQTPVDLEQPIQTQGQVATLHASTFRERLRGMGVDNSVSLDGYHHQFLAHEDFQIFRSGVMVNAEKARLADSIEAAIAWTHDQAVQIVIDEVKAHVEEGVNHMQGIEQYVSPEGARMRICKTASTDEAQPGELIEFTLRFDNVGVEAVGNVTIIDNLTARLEYVPESSESSVDAEFLAQENEAGSLVLRWEIAEPLEPGEGGVVRFQCRVR